MKPKNKEQDEELEYLRNERKRLLDSNNLLAGRILRWEDAAIKIYERCAPVELEAWHETSPTMDIIDAMKYGRIDDVEEAAENLWRNL